MALEASIQAIVDRVYDPIVNDTRTANKRTTPKRRDQDKALDKAKVMALAGKHVPAAIRTIKDLMEGAYREGVRLKAATTMIEIAIGDPTENAGEQTKVYVLSVDPMAAAQEARKRLGK